MLKPKNLNAQIVDIIGQRIICGHYEQSGQLPIEADLCEEFGVSRPSLREAIKMLASKGMLTSRTRTGTTINNRNEWNFLDRDVLTWIIQTLPEPEFLDMMFEARFALEPAATELAALKATKEDIEKISLAYDDIAASTTLQASIEPDIRFHQAILDTTQNDIVRFIGQTLHGALAISFRLTSWHQEILTTTLQRHKAVYKAIEAGDPNRARKAAQQLLMESRKDFDAKSDTKKNQ